MSRLRIDKEDVVATLYLSDGSTLHGSLFLSRFSATRAGPQGVDELLAESCHSLPFATAEGRFLLVGTPSVAAVEVSDSDRLPQGFWTRLPVNLRLAGHHHLHGALLAEEGKGGRISDAVNAPGAWLTLDAGGRLIWVSKAHLVTLEPERG